jgi:hypothetical protein
MLCGNETVTVYHRSYAPASRIDGWVRTVYASASWYGSTAVSAGNNGLDVSNAISAGHKVRIATDGDITASAGDLVVRGTTDADTPAEAKKSAESFVITAVRDNRRGAVRLHHWLVEGS